MATDSFKLIEQLNSEHEIQHVLAKYAFAIDSRALELLADCFSEESTIELTGMGTFSLPQYQDMCRTVLLPLDAVQHCVSTTVVKVSDDQATSRCYSTAHHARNSLAPDPMLTVGGQYDDHFKREKGAWRIVKRIATILWIEGNPAVLGFPVASGGMPWHETRNFPLRAR